ncbi:MAG TPA: 50S ribosomal protein L25/general stress protein Ctc [Bacillota bacterium]|nr:50S ribosomal protein L25/general stress protein Ctc [Bacillota bacterium]
MAVTLKATQRENLTLSATKKVRSTGGIPAIVYGKGEEAIPVSVDYLELMKTVRDEGRHAVISLEVEDGEKVDVMLHEYQVHPVKGYVTHADFYKIDMSEEMDVSVPLRIEGEAAGAKEGGILQQPLFELEVRAVPREIPEEITIDVSALEIGDSLTVADLAKSNTYTILHEEDESIATVLPPEAEEEEEDTEDVSVEPELVGADDEEEEEEE